jgi:hypothetical protein
MTTQSPRLARDLDVLRHAHRLTLSRDYRQLYVHGFVLPPGYNASQILVFVEIPADYPMSPPGVGKSHIYVPCGIRFMGRPLQDVHEEFPYRRGDWAWFCYQKIQWDPCQDDLVRLMELNRAYLTDPPTR